MGSKYIPPALRAQQGSLPARGHGPTRSLDRPPVPPPPGVSRAPGNGPVARRPPDHAELYTYDEIDWHFWQGGHHGASAHGTTLHGSAHQPGALAFVNLFHAANPKWASDRIIFAKSNLDLLPAVRDASGPAHEASPASAADAETPASPAAPAPSSEGFPVAHPPFAVFEQPYPVKATGPRSFRFLGWFRVARLDLLEPRSEALVRMLEKKWAVTDRYGNVMQRSRDAKKWEASLAHKWAVVKMERDEVATRVKGEPAIERVEEPALETETKGVNELLQQLRLDKTTPIKATGDHDASPKDGGGHDSPPSTEPTEDVIPAI